MRTLQELKASSPAYAGMSDEEFASRVYDKHYASKMTRDEFDVRTRTTGAESVGEFFGLGRPERAFKLPDSFQRLSDQVADPFGVQDEIVGAGEFAKRLVTSGGDFGEASKAYTKAAERIRAERDVARKDYGVLPELIGGVGTAGVGKVAQAGLSFLPRVKEAAKAGAVFGGAAGAGHSEGGLTQRLVGAGYGAGAGAVAGPLIGEVAAPVASKLWQGARAGGRKGGEFIRDTLGDVIPPLRRSAEDRYLRALQRQGMSVDEASAAYERMLAAGKFGKTQVDVPVTPADLGPAMQRQGRAIATIPGRGSTMAEEVYGARQAGQFDRMNDYLRRSLSVSRDDYAKTSDRLVKEMREGATPAYKKFYDLKDAGGRPVRYDIGPVLRKSELADANLSPALQRVMQKARAEFMHKNVLRETGRDANWEVRLGRDAIAGSSPTYKLTGRRFDSAKQALDDMIEQAKARGQNNQVRLLTQLKNDLVSVVDKLSTRPATKTQTTWGFDAKGNRVKTSFEVPVLDAKGRQTGESLYSRARDAYGTPASLKDALSKGRSFMKGDADMTGAAYKALSTAEKRMFRIGIAREARKVLGGKQIGQDMIGHFRKPNVQETLSEVMSPAKFKQFMSLVEGEKGMAATNTIVRGGSPTANKLADVEDLNAFMTMGRTLKEKGLAGAAFDAVGSLVEKTLRMREVDAHNLARMMFETDPQKVRATFARLKMIYGPRKVRDAMQLVQDRVGSFRNSASAEAGEYWGEVSPAGLDLPQRF